MCKFIWGIVEASSRSLPKPSFPVVLQTAELPLSLGQGLQIDNASTLRSAAHSAAAAVEGAKQYPTKSEVFLNPKTFLM